MVKQTSKAFRFSDEELELLEAAKERHGSYKAAIMAGLEASAQPKAMTAEQMKELLEDAIAGLEECRFNPRFQK